MAHRCRGDAYASEHVCRGLRRFTRLQGHRTVAVRSVGLDRARPTLGGHFCGPAPLASNGREEREDCGIAGWLAYRGLCRVWPAIGRRDHHPASCSTRAPQRAPCGASRERGEYLALGPVPLSVPLASCHVFGFVSLRTGFVSALNLRPGTSFYETSPLGAAYDIAEHIALRPAIPAGSSFPPLGPIGARAQFFRVERCGVDRRENLWRVNHLIVPAGRLRNLRAQQMVPGAAPERNWSVIDFPQQRCGPVRVSAAPQSRAARNPVPIDCWGRLRCALSAAITASSILARAR